MTESGMRRRAPVNAGAWGADADKPKAPIASAKVLERMDVFTKFHDEDKIQTSRGASMALFSWVLVLVLLCSEAYEAFLEHLVVDTSLGDKLNITLDMTFHALTCADVHVDAMDVAGDNQMQVEHNMLKQRLSSQGERIGFPFLEDPTDFDSKKADALVGAAPWDYCGSCFQARTHTGACCNSCQDLEQAYLTQGLPMGKIKNTAPQCLPGFQAPAPSGPMQKGEGCNLKGFMSVNKVAGNFHIAFGDSVVKDGRHIHQFIPSEAPFFNVSHTIQHVSFGDEYPGRVNPLDGKVKYVSSTVGTGLFQYFIKVIPTHYKGRAGEAIRTNRISVTERFKPLHKEGEARLTGDSHAHNDQTSVLPGVFFIYDLSPFNVEVSTVSVPFSHFLVKLCAIAGGVFSISRLLDNVFYYSGVFLGKGTGFLAGTPR
ncbi:hypothetical protein NSK_004699 [Nannochloropsis salina CCMP1776]|uniref:Endoplasmic reticulum vesicle transporter C-terminal domain-containing protein n=1 Tax=Nannochloropsis salina CCMP1776 TaxID=1027361 RepID=A0A4D9CYL8_9STRA|nr:hypothetical protein NSK_004699 [Nannochloropsis salina CCMP1776]|eukprot:TFJ83594.1 hypothetical protein NSK_004699 [Nannochloropsis salina CCMP1776]